MVSGVYTSLSKAVRICCMLSLLSSYNDVSALGGETSRPDYILLPSMRQAHVEQLSTCKHCVEVACCWRIIMARRATCSMIMTALRKPGPRMIVRGTRFVRTIAPSTCRFGSSYTCKTPHTAHTPVRCDDNKAQKKPFQSAVSSRCRFLMHRMNLATHTPARHATQLGGRQDRQRPCRGVCF